MIEYNQRIDEQISDALRRAGRVSADGLPGLDAATGASLLRQYAGIHSAEVPLRFDGHELSWDVVTDGRIGSSVSASPSEDSTPQSPVDQVLAAPPGKSLLDCAPADRAVHRAFWLLPLMLGLLGGALGWFFVRDENPRAARSLMITGAVVQVLTVCLGIALGGLTAGLLSGAQPSSGGVAWPPSESGRPTFHYFGTAT